VQCHRQMSLAAGQRVQLLECPGKTTRAVKEAERNRLSAGTAEFLNKMAHFMWLGGRDSPGAFFVCLRILAACC
jgi:hypothetical protein